MLFRSDESSTAANGGEGRTQAEAAFLLVFPGEPVTGRTPRGCSAASLPYRIVTTDSDKEGTLRPVKRLVCRAMILWKSKGLFSVTLALRGTGTN